MADKTHKVNPIQLQKFFKGLDYPVQKQDLLDKAREEGADELVMDVLNRFSEKNYNSPNDVSEEVGRLNQRD